MQISESKISQKELEKKEIQQQMVQMNIAFSERKKINLEQLSSYITTRNVAYQQRARIFLNLQSSLNIKIQMIKQFIKQFIQYFEEFVSLYTSLFKAARKLKLSKQSSDNFSYEIIQKIVVGMEQINIEEIQHSKRFINWIEKVLLQALNNMYKLFRNQTKSLIKSIEIKFDLADNAHCKVLKWAQKINESNDLLESQINLFDLCEKTDQCLKQWGKIIYQNWLKVLQCESQVREQLQKNIRQFDNKFLEVFNRMNTNDHLAQFWSHIQLQQCYDKVFESLLDQKDRDFIGFGCRQHKLKHTFEPFISLKHEIQRLGDPFPLINILQSKKFKSQLQKSQREWVDVTLYFTVDHNLLLIDLKLKQLSVKLMDKGLKCIRVTENMLELNGTERGFLFNSKRKINLHFNSIDELQQFIFYVENILDQNIFIPNKQ